MSKDPAILFYTSDFLTGVSFMSYAQRGKYITLLCLQHQKGFLTEREIKKICGKDEDVLAKFEIDKDGLYFNKRMKEESDKRKRYSEKQRENVMKRWNKVGNTNVLPLEDEDANVNGDENKKDKKKGTELLVIPSIQEITDYCKERDNNIDAEQFWHHYETRGWILSNGKKMKKWKSSVITWEKNDFNKKEKKEEVTTEYDHLF
jgi:hypothetical protein